MYIRHLEIKNIRSIEHFEMTFPEGKEAGWHVLIGDNGSGKSTIVRSAALAMLNLTDLHASREDWDNWLSFKSEKGWIDLQLTTDNKYEYNSNKESTTENRISFLLENSEFNSKKTILQQVKHRSNPVFFSKNRSVSGIKPLSLIPVLRTNTRKRKIDAWFSVAYGPFRRFTGGSSEKEKLFKTNPNLGAHLSIFGEDIALSEALAYIKELYIEKLENPTESDTLDHLKKFINESNLLPHNAKLDTVDSKNIYFLDGNGNRIPTLQMSDGFRSILSMTFELIRQLIRVYGPDLVFKKIKQGNMIIDLPGVVLIDEIDAHLHPTWQTRIGQWFLKYFPKLQFIVTTHSPLVCRASEKGSIWRLAAPGSDQESGEVTGDERDRLIYGNVLDAYGTEVFGVDVSQSHRGQDMTARVSELNKKSFRGSISPKEREELYELRAKLPTAE